MKTLVQSLGALFMIKYRIVMEQRTADSCLFVLHLAVRETEMVEWILVDKMTSDTLH